MRVFILSLFQTRSSACNLLMKEISFTSFKTLTRLPNSLAICIFKQHKCVAIETKISNKWCCCFEQVISRSNVHRATKSFIIESRRRKLYKLKNHELNWPGASLINETTRRRKICFGRIQSPLAATCYRHER